MKWPLHIKINGIQAKELAKYCFALSQAALIGTVGYIFVGETDFAKKILILTLGISVAIMLLFIGMKLLQEVKE